MYIRCSRALHKFNLEAKVESRIHEIEIQHWKMHLTVGARVDLILQAPQKMITPPKF